MTVDDSFFNKNEEIYRRGDLSTVRREILAVKDDEWIKDLLRRGAYGTLATEAGGQPFLNTHNYVYDEAENCLYLHRNKVGRTSANLLHNPRICYTVVEMGRMYAGEKACEFGVEYRSVVIFGTAEIVDDGKEACKALQMLVEKYAPHLKPGVDYKPVTPDCAHSAAVYKVKIEQWSGKMRAVAEDHPRAYDYVE
jgi:nitroimidazol reductase NimA-like FMN-containing flavoprotein (pyridoxamine 5'-phosphate oxidase superfamily)